MSGVKIEVRDKDVIDGFARMKTAAQRARMFFQSMRGPVRADLREHGDEGRGPDGPWPARKAAPTRFAQGRNKETGRFERGRRRRARKGGRLLGLITRAWRQRATNQSLINVNMVPWADIHRTGGTVGRGSILPARDFLWISAELQRTAAKGYAAWVTRPFAK